MKRNNLIALVVLSLFVVACGDATQQSRPPSVSVYPDQQSAGFKQFAKQCSACHRPPMPNIHPANLWVSTLYRMQRHRQQRGLTPMNDAQQQQVLAYLQNHSQGE